MRTTSRKARVGRACDDCSAWIAPGEKYLEHVAAPDHDDLGNTHWWRIRECSCCAVRYGRGHRLVADDLRAALEGVA